MSGTRSAACRVALGGQVDDAQICAIENDGVRTIFIDAPGVLRPRVSLRRGGARLSGQPRALRVSRQAALDWAASTGQPYDVVHAHDWQAGLVPVLLERAASTQSAARTPTVFTIHNLAYQGVFDASWLPRLGLGWDLMHVDAMEYWGRISYLKAGIVFSQLDHHRQPARTPRKSRRRSSASASTASCRHRSGTWSGS